jgi:hypothetical protein
MMLALSGRAENVTSIFAFEGQADSICSVRAFPLVTHYGHPGRCSTASLSRLKSGTSSEPVTFSDEAVLLPPPMSALSTAGLDEIQARRAYLLIRMAS